MGPGIDCGYNLGASSGAVPDGDGRARFEEGQHRGQAHVADSNECDAGLCSHFQKDGELDRNSPRSRVSGSAFCIWGTLQKP